MRLLLDPANANSEQIANGLAAAALVFDVYGIAIAEAAAAQAKRDAWEDVEFAHDASPSEEELFAARVWDEAEWHAVAALRRACIEDDVGGDTYLGLAHGDREAKSSSTWPKHRDHGARAWIAIWQEQACGWTSPGESSGQGI
jgi:hypothetical protein